MRLKYLIIPTVIFLLYVAVWYFLYTEPQFLVNFYDGNQNWLVYLAQSAHLSFWPDFYDYAKNPFWSIVRAMIFIAVVSILLQWAWDRKKLLFYTIATITTILIVSVITIHYFETSTPRGQCWQTEAGRICE